MTKTKETKKAPGQKTKELTRVGVNSSWSWSKFMGYNFR